MQSWKPVEHLVYITPAKTTALSWAGQINGVCVLCNPLFLGAPYPLQEITKEGCLLILAVVLALQSDDSTLWRLLHSVAYPPIAAAALYAELFTY